MKNEVQHALEALNAGKVLLYPTDTVWGLGCDATDADAVKKIYKLKEREESKSLIVLVNSLEMLKKYVSDIPQKALDIIENAEKPTTIIYSNPIGFAPNTIASDNTIAIRLVRHEFCEQLITAFGKPIVSTSANISGDPTPTSFSEISKPILTGVDYIVNLQQDLVATKSSTILKIDNDDLIVIRP